MIDLTPEQAAPRIASMLAAHESRTLEFKRMGDNKIVRKLLEAICAFANTEGGVLALGVTVTLLNLERPTVWDEVSDWIDRNGALANAELCRIAGVDTLKASKMLKAWVEQGVLVQPPALAKRYTSYVKPAQPPAQGVLLSEAQDN